MQKDLTRGPIAANLLIFAIPLMIGNLLQQFYNIADTWIVGQFLGADALAAVGSSYTLMVFLTSILLGLCMGSGAVFSIYFGKKDENSLKISIFLSFVFIGIVTLLLTGACIFGFDGNYPPAAGSACHRSLDAGLPLGDFLGDSRHFFV